MKNVTRFLAICAFLLTISLFSARPLFNPLSAQQGDEELRRLYNDPQLFECLSSAAQNLLQNRFGNQTPIGVAYVIDGIRDIGGPSGQSLSEPKPDNAQAESNQEGDSRILMALPNPLVNNPFADPTNSDTQSETTLVLGSHTTVIAGYNDSGSRRGPPLANKFTGFSQSFDMGAHWVDRGTLPDNPTGDAGDPVLARDNVMGRTYFSTLAFSGPGLQVFRSDDDAFTWSLPVNAAPGVAGFQDKEWMTVDNFAGSGRGNVYVAWRQFATGPMQGIRFTRSTDGGITFGPSGGILIAPQGAFNVQGAWVTVGPDHAVYVFWLDQSAGAGTPNIIRMRKSTDQGVTFGPVVSVATLLTTGVNGSLGAVGGFRTNSFAQVVVNPTNANILYLVYNDNPAGVDNGNIFFRQSTDGGSTWSAPVQLNTDATTRLNWSAAIGITPNGSRLAVTWYDRRRDPADTLIETWGRIGTISGSSVTFGPDFRISAQFPPAFGFDPVVNAVYMGDYDQVVADNNFFYTTWGDNRDDSTFPFHRVRKNPNIRFAKIPVAGPGPILDFVEFTISGGDGDGIIEPNECLNLAVKVMNDGTVTAMAVTGVLKTGTPQVTVTQPNSSYPNLTPGAMGTNTSPFQISTSSHFACGTPVDLALDLIYASGTDTVKFTLPVPTVTFSGSLTSTDSQQMGRLFRGVVPVTCSSPIDCSILAPTTLFRYDAFTFTNGPARTCVKVNVSTSCSGAHFIFAGAYSTSFNPNSVCANFLADTGSSPSPNAEMSFEVSANETIVIVISEVTANTGCPAYTVTVSGLACATSGPGSCPAP